MSRRRTPTASARLFAIGTASAAIAWGAAASAQVVESSTITNSYSYRVGSQSGGNADAPGNVSLFISDTTGGFQSDMGLELTASLNDGSFSFLHNGYCVGDCSVSITTDITFTLTNTGTSPVDLRFDSLITPGHLARSNFFGATRTQRGNFLFEVSQDSPTLYRAAGINSIRPPFVETSDNTPFNGININSNTPEWDVVDWSATNLNVNLETIGAGETSTFVYSSRLDITTLNPACVDTTLCLGYQVAFGDPRNRGDPTVSTSLMADSSAPNLLATPTFPAVGAAYDPYLVSYAFVPQGSPLPGTPPTFPPFDYDVPYRPTEAIPEPSTWAMLLLGFGAVGGFVRGRRRSEVRVVLACA
jgi:hypothetical protein